MHSCYRMGLGLLLNLTVLPWSHLAFAADEAPDSDDVATAKATATASASIRILPQTEHSEDYKRLSARWWQWALSTRLEVLFDQTGEKCAMNQPKNEVWFLGGQLYLQNQASVENIHRVKAQRHCSVPPGRRIFFPLINGKNTCPYPTETPQTLREQIEPYFRHNPDGQPSISLKLGATINGIGVDELLARAGAPDTTLFSLRTKSEVFAVGQDTLQWHQEYLASLQAGTVNAHAPGDIQGEFSCPDQWVGDGYYVLLAPLPAGSHEIRIHSQKTLGSSSAKVDVQYRLTVSE